MNIILHLLMTIQERHGYIFLKTKDDVLRKIKEFKALIENHSERRIKTLRTENGGEYTSKSLNPIVNNLESRGN